MKRKTRIRTEWLPKEDGFVCGKCKGTGKCADDKNKFLADCTAQFYWNEEQEKIICKCGRKLTTKEELEEQIDFKEIQQYGFWIRFMSDHFNPCVKCQDKIHTILMKSGAWYINNNKMDVDLTIFGDQCYFSFKWLTAHTRFTPCPKCIKQLQTKIRTSELHIYNDTKPIIELWRRWDLIEK